MVKNINIFITVVMGCGKRWGFCLCSRGVCSGLFESCVRVCIGRERKQKRCDRIWWRWTLNISKWSLPLFVHAVSWVPACPALLPAAPFPPVSCPPALRALGARSRSRGRVLRGWAGERQERARTGERRHPGVSSMFGCCRRNWYLITC